MSYVLILTSYRMFFSFFTTHRSRDREGYSTPPHLVDNSECEPVGSVLKTQKPGSGSYLPYLHMLLSLSNILSIVAPKNAAPLRTYFPFMSYVYVL